jgi:hypothetical protein
LVQVLQELLVGCHALARLEDLGGFFEQEGAHLPFRQTAAEVEKGAVLVALSTVTVGAAAFEETFQKGGVNRILREGEGVQETGFALTQGEGGEAFEFRLTHTMSKIAGSEVKARENENAR